MSLRFRLVRVRDDNPEPSVPGLYQCRQCKWVFFHPEPDYWSAVLFVQDGTLFTPLDKLKYSRWEEWSNEYADCVRGLVRIVGH